MTAAAYLVVCASVLVFFAAATVRAVRFARCPVHLRWELYPVPHEAPERAGHGGSYFEQGEWWRFPRQTSLAGELRFMVPEILFLRALHERNRPLWYRSFPFHFGLYLLAGTAAVVFSAAVCLRVAPGWAAWPAFGALRGFAALTGWAGVVLALGGAAGLLHRRLTDPALRVSTTAGDVFNLLFFVAALGLLGVGYVLRPAGAAGVLAWVSGLVRWDTAAETPPAFAAGVIAVSLLAAYIPLTHMSHFIAKYFAYHSVRWDDEPMRDDRRTARALAEYLTYRPAWSAGHVRAPGTTPTWSEVVATNPVQGERR